MAAGVVTVMRAVRPAPSPSQRCALGPSLSRPGAGEGTQHALSRAWVGEGGPRAAQAAWEGEGPSARGTRT
jgi:hypothetical protein